MQRRLRILVISHEMSPNQGSECAIGWNIVTRLAKYHDLTVMHATGSQGRPFAYREAINAYEKKNGKIEGINFVGIEQPAQTMRYARLNKRFAKLGPTGLPVLYFMGYHFWEKAAFRQALALHQENPFHAVHHLTLLAFREPGYCWKLGIPFFWGPTGGIGPLPSAFYSILSKKAALIERLRAFSNKNKFLYSNRVVNANTKAAVIYTYSLEDKALFEKRAGGKVKLMLDVGTQTHHEIEIAPKKENKILKGIWCGHLIERKAPQILIQALALSDVTREGIEFTVLGDGPLLEKMKSLAQSLQLKNIQWLSNVNREVVFQLMSEADLFVHTSIREATSSVIPEALSTGLPVICHDANGMSLAINETCGIKVPLINPGDSISGFHDAMVKLIRDPMLLKHLKAGAWKKSEEISWDSMVKTMSDDYLEATRNSSNG